MAGFKAGFKRRMQGFIYNLDRAGASLCGAPPQETLSSQIGRAARADKRWGKIGRALLDSRFMFGNNHCENAIVHADALDRVDDGREQ